MACAVCGWPNGSWRHNTGNTEHTETHPFIAQEPESHPVKTPAEWEVDLGIKVMDPDGWDRRNYEESWATPITQSEFRTRAALSTIQFTPKEGS